MIRIAVCDDEKYYREQIETILIRYSDKNQMKSKIDVFSSGEEFNEDGMNVTKYDVVFLDTVVVKIVVTNNKKS